MKLLIICLLSISSVLCNEYSYRGHKCVCPEVRCPVVVCPKAPECPPPRALPCRRDRVARVIASYPTDDDGTLQTPLAPFKSHRGESRYSTIIDNEMITPHTPLQTIKKKAASNAPTALIELDYPDDHTIPFNAAPIEDYQEDSIIIQVPTTKQKPETHSSTTVDRPAHPSGGRFYARASISPRSVVKAISGSPIRITRVEPTTTAVNPLKMSPSAAPSTEASSGTTTTDDYEDTTSNLFEVSTSSETSPVTQTMQNINQSTIPSEDSMSVNVTEFTSKRLNDVVISSTSVETSTSDTQETTQVDAPSEKPIVIGDDAAVTINTHTIPGFDSIVADVSVAESSSVAAQANSSIASVESEPESILTSNQEESTTEKMVISSDMPIVSANPDIAPSGYRSSALFGSKDHTFDPTKCNSEEWTNLLFEQMKVNDATESKRRVSEKLGTDALARVSVLCSKTTISFRLIAAKYCQMSAGDVTCLLFEP